MEIDLELHDLDLKDVMEERPQQVFKFEASLEDTGWGVNYSNRGSIFVVGDKLPSLLTPLIINNITKLPLVSNVHYSDGGHSGFLNNISISEFYYDEVNKNDKDTKPENETAQKEIDLALDNDVGYHIVVKYDSDNNYIQYKNLSTKEFSEYSLSLSKNQKLIDSIANSFRELSDNKKDAMLHLLVAINNEKR